VGLVFQVGKAITLPIDDLTILHYGQGAARRSGLVVSLKDRVDPVIGRLNVHGLAPFGSLVLTPVFLARRRDRADTEIAESAERRH